MDNQGAPLVVSQAGGARNSWFSYSIPPNGVFRFQTDGSQPDAMAGWVRLIPDSGTSTPLSSGIFAYNPGNILLTESGVPSAEESTNARIYVDLSEHRDTGLAIANIMNSNANITLDVFRSDGSAPIGTSSATLVLAANGHAAEFVDQFITGLPEGFTGVLEIKSPTPFAALTVCLLTNERNDSLLTTFPVADANKPAPAPIVFPQIADGGGSATRVISISPSGSSNGVSSFYDEAGKPMSIRH